MVFLCLIVKKVKVMDAKTKFLKLKQSWIKASEADREVIEKEMDDIFSSLSETEKKEIHDAIDEDFSSLHKEVGEIKKALSIREKLEPALSIISVSYLAKNYFHKTPQWFYQRMNGNRINGKPAKFTKDEIDTLNHALKDISNKIGSIAISS
jgi:seryl-tRNA synthetase